MITELILLGLGIVLGWSFAAIWYEYFDERLNGADNEG